MNNPPQHPKQPTPNNHTTQPTPPPHTKTPPPHKKPTPHPPPTLTPHPHKDKNTDMKNTTPKTRKTTNKKAQRGKPPEKKSLRQGIESVLDGGNTASGTVLRDGMEAALAGGSRLDNPYRGEKAGRRRVWFRGFDLVAGEPEGCGVSSTF